MKLKSDVLIHDALKHDNLILSLEGTGLRTLAEIKKSETYTLKTINQVSAHNKDHLHLQDREQYSRVH